MAVSRLTLLFQATTSPSDRETASPHIAGWSESWWSSIPLLSASPFIRTLAQARAALLPSGSAVIGFRIGNYEHAGNKSTPIGSATGKFLYPGLTTYNNDLPQIALEMSGTSTVSANTSRFSLRGMPDFVMVGGEYQPEPAFKGNVTRFRNLLVSDQWSFLGRDISQPAIALVSLGGGLATLAGATGAAEGDFVRFNRVFMPDGTPIKGAFRISHIGAGNVLTLIGLPAGATAANSGTVRWDKIRLCAFKEVTVSRAVVRKVGRPFEQYRGRQSRR